MRFQGIIVGMFCLATSATAQDRLPSDVPRQAASQPVTDLLLNLRQQLLPARRKPLEQPQSTAPVAHKVVLRLSEELFTSLIRREIDQQMPVEDVILGTPVAGYARTVGQPRVNLVPHSSQASFEVVMEGTTVSRTTGRNGPAIIHSRSTTRFRAAKQVLFSPENGFYALPATVTANTQLVTENVGSVRSGLLGRVVRRRAWREVQDKHPQALAIVQQKARQRVAAVLDSQLNEGVARLNRTRSLRAASIALLSAPSEPRYACCSTDRYVQIGASLGPAANRPIVLPTAHYLTSPVQLWIHRSVVRSQLPDVLSRLGADPLGFSDLAPISRLAPTAAVGTEVFKIATTRAQLSSPLDVETVEDWMVVEIRTEPRASRIVRR